MKHINELSILLGTWELTGEEICGSQTMKWLEGGHFLVEEFDITYLGRRIKGIEIFNFDHEFGLCKKHLYDSEGHHFVYYYDLQEKDITIWYNNIGGENFFKGNFSDDFQSYHGSWQWPGGGYSLTANKIG